MVGVFVTDDAEVDPAVAGCAEFVLGEVECFLRDSGNAPAPNAQVATGVDADAFMSYFLGRIAAY